MFRRKEVVALDLKERRGEKTIYDTPETLKAKLRTLNNNAELCKKYKQEAICYTKKIGEQYKKGTLNYTEHEYTLNKYLKGRSLEHWIQHYESQEKKIKEKITSLRLKEQSSLEKQVIYIERRPKNNLLTYSLTTLLLIMGALFIFNQNFLPNPWHGSFITGLGVGEQSRDSLIQDYNSVEGYKPGGSPEIKLGESQIFTATASGPDDSKAQWYVNDLPVDSEGLRVLDYTPRGQGEYEIKVLINNPKNSVTHKWRLIVK